jgi:hypothetical protein
VKDRLRAPLRTHTFGLGRKQSTIPATLARADWLLDTIGRHYGEVKTLGAFFWEDVGATARDASAGKETRTGAALPGQPLGGVIRGEVQTVGRGLHCGPDVVSATAHAERALLALVDTIKKSASRA